MLDVAAWIKRVARGKHGSEHLSQDEACMVFDELLNPKHDGLQLGAFLIAQRMKGETPEELAGFVEASRKHIQDFDRYHAESNAVDLPCYAGKRRAAHAHLVAAMQARDLGIPVFIHGVEHIEGRISAWQALEKTNVQRANTLQEAAHIMRTDGMVYMDLKEISPNLYRVYQLRERLGVRTFTNTVARLLNPMQCSGQLNGFFHTPYADYMAKANALFNQPRSLIFMGAEGEPELYSDRQKVVKMQTKHEIRDLHFENLGHAPYPKQVIEPLEDILKTFERMQTQPSDVELARIHRMKDAFQWASGQDVKEAPYA